MDNENKEKLADKLFDEALNLCLQIRKQRKKIYGNCWFQEDGVNCNYYAGIVNKFNRLKVLHNKRYEINEYESYLDTLIDMVNVTLFTLACVLDEKADECKHRR